MRFFIYFLLFFILLSCQGDQESNPLESFKLEDGFQMELVASEPLIADPVDMEIDEWGRMFVVEMHGYPLDVSGTGLVKRLEDTNGDGLPDKSIVFVDSLILPTGIMRWKKGFLVTDPPHVYYLEDVDDDGKADVRDIVLTGFARSNPQHNVNSPTYGLDNWIYLSHEGAVRTQQFGDLLGDEGSEIYMTKAGDEYRLPKNANGLGVRFRPDSGRLEMLSARGQFGQTFDDWGHHFQTNNASHLYHKVIAATYVLRNPDLLIPTSQSYIPKDGRGFDIFPITSNPDHQLLTDIGVLTSACGILSYSGALFPEKFHHNIFTAEPVHNLIHVDRIEEHGATFHSVPILQDREFLASKDAWFRPVNHYIAPDGSIFVLDYYRKIIEHPEWLSDEVIHSGDLYAGMDMGRIYRITPKGTEAMSFLDNLALGDASIPELVSYLADPNIWWRIHAQRLLMDRPGPETSAALREFILATGSSVGKVHAIWLLESKDQMEEEILLQMLDDREPGLRENAIKIAESYLTSSEKLVDKLLDMVSDEHPKVRFQLLLSLGNLSNQKSLNARNQLLFNDIEDPWVQYAALSAADFEAIEVFRQTRSKLANEQTDGNKAFFKKLSLLSTRSGSKQELNLFLSDLLRSSSDAWYLPLVLEGIADGIKGANDLMLSEENVRLLVSNFSASVDPSLRHQSLTLLYASGFFAKSSTSILREAVHISQQPDVEEALLADAVRIIGWSGSESDFELLKELFQTHDKSSDIRIKIMRAMHGMSSEMATNFIVSEWSEFIIDERKAGVHIFLENDENKMVLMKAIAENEIQPSILTWGQTVSLLNSSHQTVRSLARTYLRGNELNADTVWQAFQESLQKSGDISAGQEVFKKHCGICHQKSGKLGVSFGPDLAAVQNRNKASLLLDILQPNKSIADGFELWSLSLRSGTDLTGIISQQGPATLTIRDATGKETTVDRADIKELKASEWSAMPENLHAQISQEEMADLLTFLKGT